MNGGGQLYFRKFVFQALVISAVGCNVHRQSESPAKSETRLERSLSGEEARQALIRMIELDHKDDRLLQGALPFLRTLKLKPVEGSALEIGGWTCYLNERRFMGQYVSDQQGIFARFTGHFVRDEQGRWKGVITKQTRND
jgi:hypothetical protein